MPDNPPDALPTSEAVMAAYFRVCDEQAREMIRRGFPLDATDESYRASHKARVQAVIDTLASGSDAAIRAAVNACSRAADYLGAHHRRGPNGPNDEQWVARLAILEKSHRLAQETILAHVQAQRAAEAARARTEVVFDGFEQHGMVVIRQCPNCAQPWPAFNVMSSLRCPDCRGAAEAARVREETLQAACKAQCLHCETGLPTERHDYWPFKHFHRHPEDQALMMECAAWLIRALREAPRG